MAKSEGQKAKILYLKALLETQSDENHPISTQAMVEYLAEQGIHAERKAIYDDIACLQDFGMDILYKDGKYGGYYLASRTFQLPELRLLVDAVQSSRFLTSRKSMELIDKLGTLASVHETDNLKGQVVVSGRVKSMEESIYYNVDVIQAAIAQNSQIRFRYFHWGLDGKRHYRSAYYEASPYALVWAEENYYMVAHTPERCGLTNYRVDKMSRIQSIDRPRFLVPEAKNLHAADYGRSVFGMFEGKTVSVRMRFHNELVGVVLDRFGRETMVIPDGPKHFVFTVDITVSPMFLGWLAGFGDKAKILSPQSVIDAYVKLCQPSVEQYLPSEE